MDQAAATGSGLGTRAREILMAARELLDREGIEGLSMRRVGDRVGIRAASIYKHFADKEALEAALISGGLAEFADRFERSEESDPLAAFASVYRDFARGNPNLYRLMTGRPLPRERLVPDAEERAARPPA